MKAIIKVLLSIMLIIIMIAPSTVCAGIEKKIDKNGDEYTLRVSAPPISEEGISMLQYGDIIGELPGIEVFINGKSAKGTITYPNYDNTRLGIWDLEWVFTPEDDIYEPVTGTIRVNVRQREPEATEEVEEPTTPSLTATTVSLAKSTSYDINLNNKVSGAKYRWTSSDESIAKVNPKNGLVTAVSEGTAIITCEMTLPDGTVQTLTSEVVINYDDNAVVLSDTELDLEVGEKYTLKVENAPAGAKIQFKSSDKAVAKVGTVNGKVTAVSPGEAYITCTITADNQVFVLRCNVTVE